METSNDNKVGGGHRNKWNWSVEDDDEENQDDRRNKSNKFRKMVAKHRKTIREEASKLPPYEKVVSASNAETKPGESQSDTPKHNHQRVRGERRRNFLSKIRSAWRYAYQSLGLRHWAFIGVLAAYAVLGGLIFGYLERRHLEEKNLNRTNELNASRVFLIESMLSITNVANGITPEQNRELHQLLHNYQNQSDLFPKESLHWDIWDGIFYSYTVFTTIGYGHFVPTSRSGRVATIVYAIFGIPLLLAVLADFGKLLTRILKRIYSVVRHTLVHLWRLRKYKKMKARGEDILISYDEIQEDVEQFDFPIPLALVIIVGWMFTCSAVFRLWETKWTYFDAFYFFFISLSTIGLGDLTPNHPKYMIASFPFILIGLTLVSLVINLIQNKIDQLKARAQEMLEDQFGMDTVSASECEQDVEAGGKPIGDTALEAAAPESTRPKMDSVALGVLQTVTLRAKRRRIGTQTEESYIRDQFMLEQTSTEIPMQTLRPGNGSVTPRMDPATTKAKRQSDMISVSSDKAVFFDTVSTQELF